MTKNITFKLLPKQMALVKAQKNQVAFIAGRASGKSFIASLIAAKTLLEGKDVFLFAQTFRALKDNLMAETIKRLETMLGIGNFKHDKQSQQIEYNGHTIFGFSYENIESCRGYSNISCTIFDEAALAKPNIIETVIPCMRGESIIPKIYFTTTPRPNSWLTTYCNTHDVEIIRSTTFENTHLSKESIKIMTDSITNESLRRQELYGEELDKIENAIVSLNDFADEVNLMLDDTKFYIGVDCSGFGKDYNAIVTRTNRRILDKYKVQIATSSELEAYVDSIVHKYGHHNLASIDIDMAYGQALYEKLVLKYPTNLVPFSAKSDEVQYYNKRTEGYMKCGRAVIDGFLIDDDELKHILVNTTFNLKGDKLLLDPKDEIKQIIGHSPDECDALALTFMNLEEVLPPNIVFEEDDTAQWNAMCMSDAF